MAINFKLVETPAISLYSGLSGSATQMIVTPYPKDLDGTKLTITDFGTLGYCTVDPQVSGYEEIISFTGITDNGDGTATLTGLTRNLISRYPYTTSGTGKTHGASAIVVFSDNPQALAGEFGGLRNPNTWSEINTFSMSPVVPTPTSATDAANKGYVDNGVLAGGADASVTTKGISRQTVSPNKTLGTFTVTIASPAVFTLNSHGLTLNDTVQFTTSGSLPTGIAASTTYYVISAGLTANAFEIAATLGGVAINTSGSQSGTHTLLRTTPYSINDNDLRIPTQAENDALNATTAPSSTNLFTTQKDFQKGAELYIADASASSTAYTATLIPALAAYTTGQVFRIKIGLANTTTTPTLNVSGLGAKTIVKGVSTALAVGDIAVGQFCDFQYDGVNMVLKNPVYPATLPPVSFVSTITNLSVSTATNTDTTITTGFLPASITIYARMTGRNNANTIMVTDAIANYSGTTLKGVFYLTNNATSTETYAPQISTTPPKAGNNDASGNGIDITLSVNSVSVTGLVVRAVTTKTGSPTAASADFYVVANP